MDKLELNLLDLERAFYEDTTRLLMRTEDCKHQKGLPCDCLTGLAMNFWGYVLENCYEIDLTSSFEMDQENIFFRSSGLDAEDSQYKLLAPVYATEQEDYLLQDLICGVNIDSKPDSKPTKAFMKRRHHEDVDWVEMSLQYDELDMRKEQRIAEANELIYFFKQAIIGMRNQSIEKESLAFFSLAMFFFTNQTGKLVCDYLKTGLGCCDENKKWIMEYLEKYEKFLNSLDQNVKDDYTSYGVLAKFSYAFEELTGIWIGEWLKEIYGDLPFYEMVISAFGRNCQENAKNNRNGVFMKIQNACRN